MGERCHRRSMRIGPLRGSHRTSHSPGEPSGLFDATSRDLPIRVDDHGSLGHDRRVDVVLDRRA